MGVVASLVTVLDFFRFRESAESGNMGYWVPLIGQTKKILIIAGLKQHGKDF